MTHTYKIEGLTCGNCKAKVESSLSSLENVTDVKVSIETNEVEITMSEHISLIDLQKNLSPKYVISEKQTSKNINTNVLLEKKQLKKQSKLLQLKPLFLILFYITTSSILLHYKNWNWNSFMIDFVGIFFIVFSFFKMLDLKGFSISFSMYDPLAKKVFLYAKAYPFIETILGIMFLMRFQVKIASIVTIVLLGITTIGVINTLINKKVIRCACLGTTLNLPMTEATFIENIIMLIMAIVMLLT